MMICLLRQGQSHFILRFAIVWYCAAFGCKSRFNKVGAYTLHRNKRMPSGQFVTFLLLTIVTLTENVAADMEMVSREKWGAREPKARENMTTPVPHIFIHHTAMEECKDFESCSRMMRLIQDFHMDGRGWNDIAYNFLIGGDGRAYMGRGWTSVGAHTYGYNSKSIAFSLMGDFTSKGPSPAALNTTKSLIELAKTSGYVYEDYKLHGHRDVSNTECPGSELYKIIEDWPNFQKGPL